MTERQKVILNLFQRGYSIPQIKKTLGVKSTTYIRKVVKNYEKHFSFQIKSNVERELFFGDLHIPQSDSRALETMWNYTNEERFDKIVIGGDLVDFESVSNFVRDPNQRDLKKEIEYARTFLADLRNRFPKAQIFYIQGNHEFRLERFVQTKAPELWNLDELSVSNLLRLDQSNIIWINNHDIIMKVGQPFKIGHLYHLHGHEVRVNWNAVNIARLIYLKTQANVIMGHHHTSQEYTQRILNGDTHICTSVGCLSSLVLPYSIVNNWNHGFATIEYNVSGSFTVQNKKIIDNTVV